MLKRIEELNKEYIVVIDNKYDDIEHKFSYNPFRPIFPIKIIDREKYNNNRDIYKNCDFKELTTIEEYGMIYVGIDEIKRGYATKCFEDYENGYYFKNGYIIQHSTADSRFCYEVEKGNRFDFYNNYEKYGIRQ